MTKIKHGCSKLTADELLHKFATEGSLTYSRAKRIYVNKTYTHDRELVAHITDVTFNKKTVLLVNMYNPERYFDKDKYHIINIGEGINYNNHLIIDNVSMMNDQVTTLRVIKEAFICKILTIENDVARVYRYLKSKSYSGIESNYQAVLANIKGLVTQKELLVSLGLISKEFVITGNTKISGTYYEGWSQYTNYKTLDKAISTDIKSVKDIFSKVELDIINTKINISIIRSAKITNEIKSKYRVSRLEDLNFKNKDLKEDIQLFTRYKNTVDLEAKLYANKHNIMSEIEDMKTIDFANRTITKAANVYFYNIKRGIKKLKEIKEYNRTTTIKEIFIRIPTVLQEKLESLSYLEEADTSTVMLFNKNNSHIYTSRGVNIPFNVASTLYSFVKFCIDNKINIYQYDYQIKKDYVNLKSTGCEVAGYMLQEVNENHLKVGCHIITINEIETFCRLHYLKVHLKSFEFTVEDKTFISLITPLEVKPIIKYLKSFNKQTVKLNINVNV